MPTPQVDPARGFRDFELSSVLERNLRSAGYDEPRPIQLKTIPRVLDGQDVLGLAQTGTGKTAAFALPILEYLLTERRRRGPRALVVAPTRELAIQIDEEFQKLSRSTRIRTVVLYGGVSDRAQIQKLRRDPDVIVACPGRLLDLAQRGEVPLDRVEILVLDEADHMFDMGFLPDIRKILSRVPEDRQNLLFAATMPKEIRRLAEQILYRPYVAELAHSAPAKTIDHSIYPVIETRKMELLEHFLSQDDFVSAIVFARTKHRAKRLAQKLDRSGHRAIALQGNMSQPQRDRAMGGFRDGVYDVLVATDIVARGIDVDQVSHVINFDVPNTPEAYTHRIGRTGRSERSGQAFTFVTADDSEIIHAIEKKIGHSIRIGSVEGFEEAFTPARTGRKRDASRSGTRNRAWTTSTRGPREQAQKRRRSRTSDRRPDREQKRHGNPERRSGGKGPAAAGSKSSDSQRRRRKRRPGQGSQQRNRRRSASD